MKGAGGYLDKSFGVAHPPQHSPREQSRASIATRLFNREISMSRSKALAAPGTVFVVHGRNEAARKALFDLLQAAGTKPQEWSAAVATTGKAAPFIGEVLEKAIPAASAVVVLLTPDDEGRLRRRYQRPSDSDDERKLSPQARQNVIFEAGLALGVHPKRTVIVQLGEVRPFSDLSGRHLIRMEDSVAKRQELLLRLERAGCKVDRNGTAWHSAGDFAAALKTTVRGKASRSRPSNRTTGARHNSLPEDCVRLLFILSKSRSGLLQPGLLKRSRMTKQRFDECIRLLMSSRRIGQTSSHATKGRLFILPTGMKELESRKID